ncbi:NADH-quinone oxidoreductase subunit J [Hydrogenivirga sp. 128-5-R1-1]|uniref:NADH-quinone oxidoreductase subunit J family protein n=1 Tax=Hydrogenivirga sp. 128-5-R1-1 TaxID=392423 RepID=UPI00015F36F2|nr:NADH-quinone oxidoreductase subunit J [Hydrogenivirga sp. 128-5-R1-1]EDP76494.1 NADH dehydrogenase I chain J [Hydrogenivirga sp. 128-5-R1-1]
MVRLVIFLIFSAWAIISGVGVITFTNPIYVILWLLSALIAVAGIFFTAGAELVGALQLLIYAVAIAVFYVFVLTAVPWEKAIKKGSHYRMEGVLSLPLVVLLYVEMAIVFFLGITASPEGKFRAFIEKLGNTEVVGSILFTRYFFAFEVVSLVLLIGMIGAVLIGRKESQTYEDNTP